MADAVMEMNPLSNNAIERKPLIGDHTQNDPNYFDPVPWIPENIKSRRCNTFIPEEINDCICKIGCQEGDHEPECEKNASSDSKTKTTNDSGNIDFIPNDPSGAKIVRVNESANMSTMLDLIKKEWQMETPNLLISVSESTGDCKINPRLKDVFQRSLMKAAYAAGAWIITGGLDTGVAKIVGDAVEEYKTMFENSPVVIGVAPGGVIVNKREMRTWKEMTMTFYKCKGMNLEMNNLNPNHSHFIFVECGNQGTFGKDISFRNKLEQKISTLNPSDGNADQISLGSVFSSVPRVLLVLNGDSSTLETVQQALRLNTPVVIIKGSGGAADLLAYSLKQRVDTKDLEKQMKCTNFCEEKDYEVNIQRIWDCLNQSLLIHIPEWNSDSGEYDLDTAILKGLLNAKNERMIETLGLALAWDRIDFAKSDLFTDDNISLTVSLVKIMVLAIQMGRVNFVQLFLDKGIRLTDFLNNDTQKMLYIQDRSKRMLKILFNRMKLKKGERQRMETIEPSDVDQLSKHLIGNDYIQRYLNKEFDDKEARMAQVLFVWSILTNQQKMAEIFWRKSKDPMATALIGSALFSAMSHLTKNRQLMTNLKDNASMFTRIAIGVFNEIQRKDQKKAQEMMTFSALSWGYKSFADIAVMSKNEGFISHPEFLELFENILKGEMKDNGYLKLFVCTVIPVLIPLIVTFKTIGGDELDRDDYAAVFCGKKQKPKEHGLETTSNSSEESPGTDDKKILSIMNQITTFYRTPVARINLNWIFYMIFLCLYSYTLICKLGKEWSVEEMILIVWVFTFFTEEVRQVCLSANNSRMKAYFKDVWNLIDIITILLFVLGMILRFMPYPLMIETARIILGLDLVAFFMRLLQSFCLHKELGPKLAMIFLTFQSMISFLLILMVFTLPYAIACHAILYPNAELNLETLIAIFRRPYWNIYGDLLLNEIEEDAEDCTNDAELYKNGTFPRCSTESGKYFVPVMLGVFMLICNILLLNLLIVMFSNTVERVQNNIDMYFNLQLLSLIDEYKKRPHLPPPLSLFEDVYVIMLFFKEKCQKCCPNQNKSKWICLLDKPHLRLWEQDQARQYDLQSKTLLFEQLEKKLTKMQTKQQALTETLEDVQQVTTKIVDVHSKMLESMRNQLRWIMDSLKEHNLGSSRDIPEMQCNNSSIRERTLGSRRETSKVNDAEKHGSKQDTPRVSDAEDLGSRQDTSKSSETSSEESNGTDREENIEESESRNFEYCGDASFLYPQW